MVLDTKVILSFNLGFRMGESSSSSTYLPIVGEFAADLQALGARLIFLEMKASVGTITRDDPET